MLVSEIIEKTRCEVTSCFCNNTSFYNCPCISFSEILVSSCGFELLSFPFISPGRSQCLTVKVKVHFSTCEYSFLLSSFIEKLSFPHYITLYCTPDHMGVYLWTHFWSTDLCISVLLPVARCLDYQSSLKVQHCESSSSSSKLFWLVK